MTTTVTVATAERSARVQLESGDQTGATEGAPIPPFSTSVYHVYDEKKITVSEIKDDSPND